METNTIQPISSPTSLNGQPISNAVKELLGKIDILGQESAPRGQKVREIELETLRIDPNFAVMDFPARPFNWKYFMGELGWYLLKDNNIDFINNFSSFWKNIAGEGGNINSNYGTLLFGPQLQWALDSLKKDKNTRQAVCFLNQPKFQYEGNKDFVCTMYLNFWIRDNKLNMKVQMRSNDIFYGLSYDAPFFAFIQQSMWHWLRTSYPELGLGTYYHCADNIHYYERHFELAEKIMSEETGEPYWFHLRAPLFNLNNGIMLPSVEGLRFIESLSNLMKQETMTQEESKELLQTYFYIQ